MPFVRAETLKRTSALEEDFLWHSAKPYTVVLGMRRLVLQSLLSTFTSELSPGSPQRASCTPHLWYQLSSHLLGLVETGFSSSCLQELGRLAGWDPKNSTVSHITQNPPVSCTLCLGGGRRGERTQLLPLNCCRWCGLRFLLLPYLRLHLGQKAKRLWSLWTTAMMEKRLSSGESDLKVINQG